MLSAPAGTSNLVPESPSDDGIEGITPEPDSTEDSFGLHTDHECRSASSPIRRCSQPVTGSPRDAPDSATRRSSEGSNHLPVSGEDNASSARCRMPTNCRGPGADWTSKASSLSHIFIPSSSGESCYYSDCKGSGSRVKCVACRISCHEVCTVPLNSTFTCRQSFRESIRKYREQTTIQHHWVKRKNLKGKCKHCSKTFQSKLLGNSGTIGLCCSWCKYSYHHKDTCIKALQSDEHCDLGVHSKVIVPPSWIVKVPRKGSFKSSLKTSPNKKKKKGIKRIEETAHQDDETGHLDKERPFCLKPIPSPNISPILVFLNPKSGGNQGAKLMQKFQWLLNPRQVFDLTDGGPQLAIELFKKVPNVRLLACGGDGTVGWLLSVLDRIPFDPPPAVGVLPLGTGNDLSRSLGWGGAYIDEPISKILSDIQQAETVQMDRWRLTVTKNFDCSVCDDRGEDVLPLNVINNYFSLGVDAQIALQFHEAREANPSKFNSRIRNKMFYGQAGGKDLLLRKWKDLSDFVTVECDGKDITHKLREHRVHSVLFANIPSFGSGTHPWNKAWGEQRIDDGQIEVIGLTTYQLPLLQAGGHGTFLGQCKSAKIVTSKTIPMQVDGEASRLNPSTIQLSFLNQVTMLAKSKKTPKTKMTEEEEEPVNLNLKVFRISMVQYELYHHQKDMLKDVALAYGEILASNSADLEQIRYLIEVLKNKNQISPDAKSLDSKRKTSWCFLDSVTALRFFRIDRAQEHLHFVLDICDDNELYILDEETDGIADEDDEADLLQDLNRLSLKDQNGLPYESDGSSEKVYASDSPLLLVPNISLSNSPGDGEVSPLSPASPKAVKIPTAPLSPASHKERTRPSPHIKQILEKTTEGILKAARLGDIRMLTELHREGYSLLSIDETGKTALHYGARFGHKEVVKFLINQAPVCILDMVDNEKGQAALHKAAAYKRRTICCMLVAAGASLLIEDHAGLTPRQMALMAEDHELSEYLQSQEDFQTDKLLADGNQIPDYETPV